MDALKILIVEDQRIVAANIKEYLKEIGYTVQLAYDYEIGLNLFKSFQPDLVLLDIILDKDRSKPNGIDLAFEISRLGDTPFIFLSGNAKDDQVRERAKSMKPSGFLVKPPNMFQIQVAIEVAIEAEREKKKSFKDYVFVKNGKAYQRIELKKLGWVKAKRNWSEITTESECFQIKTNLAGLEKTFKHPDLRRIHKSYIINMSKIVRTKGNVLYLQVGDVEEKITIGRVYRDDFWDDFE